MNPFLEDLFPPNWKAMTPDLLEDAVKKGISEAQEQLDKIKAVPESDLNYENTFAALESASDSLDRAWGRVNHLDSVANSDEQRKALNAQLPVVTQFYSEIPLDTELWQKLKSFSESTQIESLKPIQKRYIEETCLSFINAGADLPKEEKKRFSELQSELSQKTQKYSENVLDSTNDWEIIVTESERLKGLPESAKAAAKQDALSKGHGTEENPAYRFTLQFPSMMPVMQHAEDESLRKSIWEASGKVGNSEKFDNTTLIREILELRSEKVGLLGFQSFADWTTQRRMAKSGKNALKFVEDLHLKVKERFDQECLELQTYKASKTGGTSAPLEPWETAYWAEKRRLEEYDFDEEELRPYFPISKVMSGMFELCSTLFGITITTLENSNCWDEDVIFYQINDTQSGEHLGSFYADWHPRENKRGGAWMNNLDGGLPPIDGAARQPHLGLICGNMTKPVGDQPACLTHREVETIFHEFGHLLHQLLSDVEIKSLSGTNVAWDFVELPSQIMENFCWNRESLDFFARHVETGEAIPEALFEKMQNARNYMSASGFMRQLSLGKMDLELHHNAALDLSKGWEQLEQETISHYLTPTATPTVSILRRFGHLFSGATGYAAGYYSYKWAEVLDADAFTRFEKEGVLNSETGMSFRESILSKGNSAPPEELYKNFMNRAPKQEPLLVRAGLS